MSDKPESVNGHGRSKARPTPDALVVIDGVLRKKQALIEDMRREWRLLRDELDKTKDELRLVTEERNRAVERLQRAGLA